MCKASDDMNIIYIDELSKAEAIDLKKCLVKDPVVSEDQILETIMNKPSKSMQ